MLTSNKSFIPVSSQLESASQFAGRAEIPSRLPMIFYEGERCILLIGKISRQLEPLSERICGGGDRISFGQSFTRTLCFHADPEPVARTGKGHDLQRTRLQIVVPTGWCAILRMHGDDQYSDAIVDSPCYRSNNSASGCQMSWSMCNGLTHVDCRCGTNLHITYANPFTPTIQFTAFFPPWPTIAFRRLPTWPLSLHSLL